VGLFTEKTEVTIHQQSTQDLTQTLRAKIRKLMLPDEIEDGDCENGETIDVEAEMGLKPKKKMSEVDNDLTSLTDSELQFLFDNIDAFSDEEAEELLKVTDELEKTGTPSNAGMTSSTSVKKCSRTIKWVNTTGF